MLKCSLSKKQLRMYSHRFTFWKYLVRHLLQIKSTFIDVLKSYRNNLLALFSVDNTTLTVPNLAILKDSRDRLDLTLPLSHLFSNLFYSVQLLSAPILIQMCFLFTAVPALTDMEWSASTTWTCAVSASGSTPRILVSRSWINSTICLITKIHNSWIQNNLLVDSSLLIIQVQAFCPPS